MPEFAQHGPVNHLLAELPPQERALLLPHVEPVGLEMRRVLQEPDLPQRYLWFPASGVASMLSQMVDGAMVEVATVGREGMIGLSAVLGAERLAQLVFIQIPGQGHRIPVEAFERLADRLPVLRTALLRYAAALVTQIAQGSACNRLHAIETRCARWLLMSHDRVDGDIFPLTQEFLAQMLGASRPSVSIAAGALQAAGLIRYVRGVITILDRAGLEQASCECYDVITREFRQLLARG